MGNAGFAAGEVGRQKESEQNSPSIQGSRKSQIPIAKINEWIDRNSQPPPTHG